MVLFLFSSETFSLITVTNALQKPCVATRRLLETSVRFRDQRLAEALCSHQTLARNVCPLSCWKKKLKEQSNPFHEKNLAGDLTCPMDIIHALSEPVPRLIRMLVFDWAQKMCLCPIGGQNLSRWFRDLLIQKSSYANSTVCCTASVGELWSRRVFSENGAQKTKKFHT